MKIALPLGDKYHRPAANVSVTGCGRPLDHVRVSDAMPAHAVPPEQRCMAAGCRGSWPPYLRVLAS